MILASPAVKDAVKESLKKAVGMRTTLEQTAATLKDLRAQVKEISEEQARLRTNMDKLPQTSELYKRYLGQARSGGDESGEGAGSGEGDGGRGTESRRRSMTGSWRS